MSYDTYEKIMRTNCFYGYFHIQVLQPWCTHRLVSFHIDVKNNRKNIYNELLAFYAMGVQLIYLTITSQFSELARKKLLHQYF